MTIDLSTMSRLELVELRANLDEAIKQAEERERSEALRAAEEAAAKFGFSLEEIAATARNSNKKGKAVAKYRNPENHEETWSGRGRKPHWVHAALTAGVDISELEI